MSSSGHLYLPTAVQNAQQRLWKTWPQGSITDFILLGKRTFWQIAQACPDNLRAT